MHNIKNYLQKSGVKMTLDMNKNDWITTTHSTKFNRNMKYNIPKRTLLLTYLFIKFFYTRYLNTLFKSKVSRSRFQNGFLERIVKGDKTWVHYHQPETKRQRKKWRSSLITKIKQILHPSISRKSHAHSHLGCIWGNFRTLHGKGSNCDQLHTQICSKITFCRNQK